MNDFFPICRSCGKPDSTLTLHGEPICAWCYSMHSQIFGCRWRVALKSLSDALLANINAPEKSHEPRR